MELKIKSQVVIAEREKRAWSQQHLADASGLALRTIQRIEAHGAGSYESLKALASCLELPATALRIEAEAAKPSSVMRSRSVRVAGPVVGASLLVGIAGIVWIGTASAKQVLVDFGLTLDKIVVLKDPKTGQDRSGTDTQELKAQLLVREGEKREESIGMFKLVLTPTVMNDGRVALSARLYEQRDTGLEILTAPELVVSDGKEAKIEFTFPNPPQRTYRVTFKPKIQ